MTVKSHLSVRRALVKTSGGATRRTFPFGKAKKVWLSYESENIRAKALYQKYGFVENGERCGNEIVAVYDL